MTFAGPEIFGIGSPLESIPDDVVAGTRARYVDAFERVTGIPFDDYLADPGVVLR